MFKIIKKHHMLMMIVCCVLPILGLFFLFQYFPAQKAQWGWLLILLCPLSHILLMSHGKNCHTHQKESE